MGSSDRGIEIATGQREGDGRLSPSFFGGDLLALAVEGQGERASTLLLTREQALRLQEALCELLPLLEPEATQPAHDFDQLPLPETERTLSGD